MSDAYFTAVAGAPGRFVPSEHVRGPWSPEFMHAGPPSALIAHVVSQLAEGVPEPAVMARFAVEIVRPVPVAPVLVRARVVRPGRRVALVEAVLSTDATDPVMIARVWLIRQGRVAVPHTPAAPPPAATGALRPRPDRWGAGYLDSVTWTWVSGSFEAAGPATVWAMPRLPVVDGAPLTAVERVLVVADSGSGISAVASPTELIFVNTDLTVHLHRMPVGEQVWMRSESVLQESGVGLATTVLGDSTGAIGVCAQSLFVSGRP